MRLPIRALGATLACVCALAGPASAQTASKKYGELLKRLPAQANFLMLIDGDSLLASPIAQRENWKALAEKSSAEGLGLANDISHLVVASDLDLQSLQENWKLGMAELHEGAIDVKTLAEREGGYVENVGETPTAWSPRGLALLSFPPNILAFVQGADRRAITKWIDTTIIRPRNMSPPFADRAIFRADQGSQVVLALDLENAISVPALELWLRTQDIIADQKLDPKLLAQRLATAKRALLQIDIKETIQGTLRVEFDQPVDYAAPVLKQLLLTTLEDRGAMLADLAAWRPAVDRQKAFELTGTLKTSSLKMILGLAHPPGLVARPRTFAAAAPAPAASPGSVPAPAAAPAQDLDKKDVLQSSQQYFHAVVDALDSLKTQKGASTYSSLRLWYDRAARSIEELPLLGVDKDLLDWGAKVARTLREMSYGINYSAKNQSYQLAASPNGYGGYYYGGYGYVTGSSKGYNQAVYKKQSDAMLSTDLDSRWQVLQTTISDTRRAMTEKYQSEF